MLLCVSIHWSMEQRMDGSLQQPLLDTEATSLLSLLWLFLLIRDTEHSTETWLSS